MTKIAFLSGDLAGLEPGKAVLGGVQYARQAIPGFGLEKWGGYTVVHSYHCEIAPAGHIRVYDRMLEPHDDCDVLWFQRFLSDDGPRFARAARGAGQIVLNDLDDNLFALPDRVAGSQNLKAKNSPRNNIEHYRKFLSLSDAITVSTDTLADELRPLKVPTFVVRNALDITAWPQLDVTKQMVVGWVGAVSWRGNDLPILKSVRLGEWLEDHNVPFYHGGHQQNPVNPKQRTAWEEAGIDPSRVQVAWNPIQQLNQYVPLWAPLTVSLIPIELNRFGRSKSWLKGLESSASGLPFIASATPEYRKLNEQGAGRIAKNERPSDWISALEELLDPAVRKAEGERNRKVAEANDISQRWSDWAHVIEEVVREERAA